MSDRYAALSATYRSARGLGSLADFEMCSRPLAPVVRMNGRDMGGWPSFDPVVMVKLIAPLSHASLGLRRRDRPSISCESRLIDLPQLPLVLI